MQLRIRFVKCALTRFNVKSEIKEKERTKSLFLRAIKQKINKIVWAKKGCKQ